MNDFFSKKYIFKNQTVVVVSLCPGPRSFSGLSFLKRVQLLQALGGSLLRSLDPQGALPTGPSQPDQLSEKLSQGSKSTSPMYYPDLPHPGFLQELAQVMPRSNKIPEQGEGKVRQLDPEGPLDHSRVCHLPGSAQRI